MKALRRLNLTQTYYFITIVTYMRRPILAGHADLLWECWPGKRPVAWAIMPDHFHAILNCGRQSLSDIVHSFKITFSRRYRNEHGPGRVWQNRFWDHAIRDSEDFKRHFDYIHHNPVHHGLVTNPAEYQLTSFHTWLERGNYELGWRRMDSDADSRLFGE